MNKELEKELELFHNKATTWFLNELEKVCLEHSVWVEGGSGISVVKDGEELTDADELYNIVFNKVYDLSEYLEHTLGYNYQMYQCWDGNKFIH